MKLYDLKKIIVKCLQISFLLISSITDFKQGLCNWDPGARPCRDLYEIRAIWAEEFPLKVGSKISLPVGFHGSDNNIMITVPSE